MLDQLVETVRGGESQTLVVRGEPGVGKTALLDYVAEHVSGCRVVRAAGVQSEMELAFAGLDQLLTPPLDRLERLPVPQVDALSVSWFGVRAPAIRTPSPSWSWFTAHLGPEAQALDHEFQQTLEQALAQLPHDWRTAVVLRDIEGLSTQAAALIVGARQAAFKSCLHRGRMQLGDLLEPYLKASRTDGITAGRSPGPSSRHGPHHAAQ